MITEERKQEIHDRAIKFISLEMDISKMLMDVAAGITSLKDVEDRFGEIIDECNALGEIEEAPDKATVKWMVDNYGITKRSTSIVRFFGLNDGLFYELMEEMELE